MEFLHKTLPQQAAKVKTKYQTNFKAWLSETLFKWTMTQAQIRAYPVDTLKITHH